jgi:hypothetical protein
VANGRNRSYGSDPSSAIERRTWSHTEQLPKWSVCCLSNIVEGKDQMAIETFNWHLPAAAIELANPWDCDCRLSRSEPHCRTVSRVGNVTGQRATGALFSPGMRGKVGTAVSKFTDPSQGKPTRDAAFRGWLMVRHLGRYGRGKRVEFVKSRHFRRLSYFWGKLSK